MMRTVFFVNIVCAYKHSATGPNITYAGEIVFNYCNLNPRLEADTTKDHATHSYSRRSTPPHHSNVSLHYHVNTNIHLSQLEKIKSKAKKKKKNRSPRPRQRKRSLIKLTKALRILTIIVDIFCIVIFSGINWIIRGGYRLRSISVRENCDIITSDISDFAQNEAMDWMRRPDLLLLEIDNHHFQSASVAIFRFISYKINIRQRYCTWKLLNRSPVFSWARNWSLNTRFGSILICQNLQRYKKNFGSYMCRVSGDTFEIRKNIHDKSSDLRNEKDAFSKLSKFQKFCRWRVHYVIWHLTASTQFCFALKFLFLSA